MKEKLRQLLAQRQMRRIVDTGRVPSAVLLPVYSRQGQYHILFIKRTEYVTEHKGQISFPGGTTEKADKTLLDTALRECCEEIGLHAEDIEILGELDNQVTTTSNFIVSTFVAAIPWPYQFKMQKYEVAEIIEIPILALLDRHSLQPGTEILDGQVVNSYTYHYHGKIIWGATARILRQFLDIYAQAMADK